MKIELEVDSVTIVTGHGSDHIMINTTIPNAIWPFNGGQMLKAEAAAGSGAQWVRDNFNIEPTVIKV